MKKVILCSILVLNTITATFLQAQNNAPPWDKSSISGIQSSYAFYKQSYTTSKTFENSWKLARACYFFATFVVEDENIESKKSYYEEGKNAADFARLQNPRRVEGHYYFAINLGSWAEADGALTSLFAIGDMFTAVDEAVKIAPSFEDGSPLLTRARMYHKAPGWPISIGDHSKAEADYKEAMKFGPKRITCRFFAEFYLEQGKKKDAHRLVRQGLAIPFDASNKIQEDKEILELKNIQNQL